MNTLTPAPDTDPVATNQSLGFEVTFIGHRIHFTNDEGIYYSRIFKMVDADEDGKIGGSEGAAFLRRARLPNEINREIWRLASGGKSQEFLSRDGWFVAMKLVALAQDVGACSLEPLLNRESLPLADFMLNVRGDYASPQEVSRSEESIATSWVIKISDPVIIGSGYARFTQYTVSTIICHPRIAGRHTNLTRRYSDFEWLHLRLLQKFPGLIIPPIPEKRWMGNLDPTFVEERKQALDHYINQVARHPQLSPTLELQILLTGSNEGLVAAKELMETSNQLLSFSSSSGSVSSLFSSITSSLGMMSDVPIDVKTDEDYAKIGKQIELYEERVAETSRAVDYWYRKARERGYELSRLGNFVNALAVHDREDEAACQFLQTTGEHLETESNMLQDHLDNQLAEFVTPIRYQYAKVGSVKLVMGNREAALTEVAASHASMQRNKERFAAARARSGAPGSALKAEQKVVQAEGRMNEARLKVDLITDSLKEEIVRYQKSRKADFDQLSAKHAKQCLAYSQHCRSSWERFVQLAGFTSAELFASLERIGSTKAVSVPPISVSPGVSEQPSVLERAANSMFNWT